MDGSQRLEGWSLDCRRHGVNQGLVLPGVGFMLLGFSITLLIWAIRRRDLLRGPEMVFLIFVGLLGLVPLTGIILYDCPR